MDKRKVIAAYRRGFITIQECAQIIGVDSRQINRLMDEPIAASPELKRLEGHSV